MFSEASACSHGGGGGRGGGVGETPFSGDRLLPPVLASSGGHYSGRYASYWNAFLLSHII